MPGMIPPPPNYPPTVPRPAPYTRKTSTPTAQTVKPRRPRITQHIDEHPRLRAVAYNATAAGAGWWCGLGPWVFDGITHYGQAHDVERGVWVGVGITVVTLLVEARTHAWRRPDRPILVRAAGWAGRIPFVTALLALALYGPDATL